jgi:hypothetical protein
LGDIRKTERLLEWGMIWGSIEGAIFKHKGPIHCAECLGP